MSFSEDLQEKISVEVIKTLVSRFESFPEDASNIRNAPFHEAFLKAFADKLEDKVSDVPFFISLSSWLHGLNTTLGQTFFENVAHYLCQGEKREYTSKKLGNLQIHKTQKDNVNTIITDLSNSISQPNLADENQLLFISDDTQLVNVIDFSADVFIEDNNKITAIELKSVHPNSGEMKGEKQKILEGKAALFNKFSGKEINFYIGFPFDPKSDQDTTYDKTRFLGSIINMTKYFANNETLIASELWDFLSGEENTMEQILEIINTISTTQFLEKYRFLNDNTNRSNNRYAVILREWNLYSELKLIDNGEIIKEQIGSDQRLNRLYNQKPFRGKGVYNIDRYSVLAKLI
ncbi:MAG: Type-2 restriction enzyme MjaII [Candidatus Syntrophoarchaeum sp. GoM_oil]|nr:MAG: Type-2 restriction enzyme MjaII [Candidatus Syntrophoarchaeum sp. GoM_oil]